VDNPFAVTSKNLLNVPPKVILLNIEYTYICDCYFAHLGEELNEQLGELECKNKDFKSTQGKERERELISVDLFGRRSFLQYRCTLYFFLV
jgi:hypothetical protein